jgi:hypothetical protein
MSHTIGKLSEKKLKTGHSGHILKQKEHGNLKTANYCQNNESTIYLETSGTKTSHLHLDMAIQYINTTEY